MNRRDAIKSLSIGLGAATAVAGASLALHAAASPAPRTFLPDGIEDGIHEEMASFEEYEHLENRLGVIHVRFSVWEEELFHDIRRPTRADIHRVLKLPPDVIVIGWGRKLDWGHIVVMIAHESLPNTECGIQLPKVFPEYRFNDDCSYELVSLDYSDDWGRFVFLPGRHYLTFPHFAPRSFRS